MFDDGFPIHPLRIPHLRNTEKLETVTNEKFVAARGEIFAMEYHLDQGRNLLFNLPLKCQINLKIRFRP